mgnify:CR=1 FL=1
MQNSLNRSDVPPQTGSMVGTDVLLPLLARAELFQDAPEEILQLVLKQSAPRHLTPDEILLSPEQDNDFVYVLLSGTFSLHFDALDSPGIRELAAGVSVGEMSLIDETRPSAYVVAREHCLVLPIHRDLFFRLIDDVTVVSRNMLRLLTQWIRANTRHVVQDRRQIVELSSSALVDCLTGLYNRRWLDKNFARLLAQQDRIGSSLCLLVIDIDHFKAYNDSQGHRAGDLALIALGDTLRSVLRPSDFATRYGGDEIMVLLQHTSAIEGREIAERIRRAVAERPIEDSGSSILAGITVSIGLSASHAGSTPESLVTAADRCLYRAKARGRDCICSDHSD